MLKKRKKILVKTLVVSLVVVSLFLCCKFLLREQITGLIKWSVGNQIIKREEELLDLVEEMREETTPEYIYAKMNDTDSDMVYYKTIDSEHVEKIFKYFRLLLIKNEMDKQENRYVRFQIYPYMDLLWEGYAYGFYYSDSDKPIDMISGKECSLQFVVEDPWTTYSYKTERIADKWWFFEQEMVFKSNNWK